MEAATAAPPAGAPRCWGRQHADNDKECNGCTFNYTCKSAYQQAGGASARGQWVPPGYAPPPQPTYYVPQQQQPPAYRPLPMYGQPQQPQATYPLPYQPPPPPPPPQQARGNPPPGYGGYQPPVYAPAGDQFQSIFGQYPGEDIAERLGKNIILRALEAIFNELTRFFHYWTWPKMV